MNPSTDVLIVGGGVIGLTSALFLARDGLAVTILEKGDFGAESSWAGAGILPPSNLESARSSLDLLRAHSALMHPVLSADLRERTGIDNGYLRCGGIEFVDREDADSEWRSNGVLCHRLDESKCRALEPALVPRHRIAFHLPGTAQLRNPRHVKALRAACASYGVRMYAGCSVFGLERQGRRITGVRSSQGRHQTDVVVVAAGAWSDSLLETIGCRLNIHPVRGQIAMLNTGEPVIRHVVMLGPRYLVPRPDARVLVGSTEENAGFDKRTTAEAIHDLLEFGFSLVPSLRNAHLERSWAGLRPGTPDDLPFLGPAPDFDNLFVVAGHFRAGIQLSPATALLLSQMVRRQALTIPLEAFRLDRPTTSTHATTFRS